MALIYRLEAGVIKQLQSWIQMRNLVCDLGTQGNEKTISHLVMLGPSQSSYLTHFEAQCERQEAESTEESCGWMLTRDRAAPVADWMLTCNLKLTQYDWSN